MKLKISLKNIFLSAFVVFFEKSGMKDILSVPSARTLLKILGNLIATKKTSAIPPAPRDAAMRISLKKPSTLLMRVIPDVFIKGLIICISSFIFLLKSSKLNL